MGFGSLVSRCKIRRLISTRRKEIVDLGRADTDGPAEGRHNAGLQDFQIHPARPEGAREPAAAQGRLRGSKVSPRTLRRAWTTFKCRKQLRTLSKAGALSTPIEKFLDPEVNLSPNPALNRDGSVNARGLDSHAMDTKRRFNEENNGEAGEHWTPRGAVKLMGGLVFLPSPARSSPLLGAPRWRVRHGRYAHRRRVAFAGSNRQPSNLARKVTHAISTKSHQSRK